MTEVSDWNPNRHRGGGRSITRWIATLSVVLLAAGAANAATEIEERVRDHFDLAAAGGLQPVDFHHLVFAFFWRDTLPDLGVVERGLDRLGGLGRIDPLMADELRLLRARLAVEGGRPAAARELFRAMGGLSQWWVGGPVEIGELADFDDLARLPDSDSWRAAPGSDPLGWVRLSGFAWPAKRQMLFLATTVSSDAERPVAIRVGAAQAARVWLNGREVLTTPRPLERAEDQIAGGGWLRRGENTVVAAVASESDDWWLRVRLTAPDGGALDGVREVGGRPQAFPASDRTPPQVRTLEEETRHAVRAGKDEANVALAAFLVLRRPQAVGAGDAKSVCRAARGESPGEARLLELLLTTEPLTTYELLRDAVAAEPDLVWARLELAGWYADRGLHDEAAAVLDPVVDEPAAKAVALDLDSKLWGPLALPDLMALSRRYPECEMVGITAAHRALDGRRWDLASEVVARLEASIPGSSGVGELRERLAEDCGDGAGLLTLVAEGLDLDPNDHRLRLRLVRLLSATGDADEASEILAEGLHRSPADIDMLMESARLEHAAGDDVRALELSRKVLAIRPQDRRAQRLVELLGGEAEDLSWLRGVDELWRMADGAPHGDPAVVLLDHVEVHFLPSRLTEERVQRAILITAAERADEFKRRVLPWVAETQRLRVLSARVLRRDGSEQSARQGDTPRLSEPEFNLYYDTRLRVLDFPTLEDGDLIELSYVKTETIESNETGPYNGGLLRLGHTVPVALAEIELVGRGESLPAFEILNLDGAPTRHTADEETVRLSWVWRNLPALGRDLPPAPELLVGPHLAYSNHPDWGDLSTWYERHVAPRVRASRQVEELASRLTDGVDDRLEKIARIYTFVTNEVRYVGLEFGEHKFRPFSADWVLNHRIGDCKDKAALLVALLDAVDIPARMVMVRTADLGPAVGQLALLEIFNHAIAYLPEDDLWLDGTASGHAILPPPTFDQGATVLVVNGSGSRPQVTPSPGGGVARTSYSLGRADGGLVALEVRIEDSGEAADSRRAQFAGSQDPRQFARWLQRSFPGAELTADPRLLLLPSRDPVTITLEAVVPKSALASRGGIAAYPGGFDWAARLVPSAVRSDPLLVAVRPDLEWKLRVDLGRPAKNLPASVRLNGDYGSLRLDIEAVEMGYEVSGYFHLEPGLIAAEETAPLRSFLLEVERHLSRPLETP